MCISKQYIVNNSPSRRYLDIATHATKQKKEYCKIQPFYFFLIILTNLAGMFKLSIFFFIQTLITAAILARKRRVNTDVPNNTN